MKSPKGGQRTRQSGRPRIKTDPSKHQPACWTWLMALCSLCQAADQVNPGAIPAAPAADRGLRGTSEKNMVASCWCPGLLLRFSPQDKEEGTKNRENTK